MLRNAKITQIKSILEVQKMLKSTKIVDQARVVISGAGVVGNSVAYYLAKNGWTDVVVLDQSTIGSGRS